MKKLALILALCAPMTCHATDNNQVVQEKTMLCVTCHGAEGVSVNPQWPNLAGQHISYLVKQLKDFQSDERNNAIMSPIAATLSDEDIAQLALFYAGQPIPKGATPKKYLKRGEQLYRGGDFKKHISACIACHGPRGIGNRQAKFPVLSGQHAPYIIEQLQAYKDGKRHNDLNEIMRDISSRMSKEDMEAVAYYVQGLH